MAVCVTPLRRSRLARTPSEWFTQKRQDIESCQPSRLPGTLGSVPRRTHVCSRLGNAGVLPAPVCDIVCEIWRNLRRIRSLKSGATPE
jgi:hypothetical protein